MAPGTANAEGILDAACSPGAKMIIKSFRDYPGTTQPRGNTLAGFTRARNAAGVETEYLMLPFSRDSGKDDGGISLWNWSDPGRWSAPILRRHFPIAAMREQHALPSTDMIADDWRTWVLQASTGLAVLDLDSAVTPMLRGVTTIAGAGKGGAGSKAVCSGTCAASSDAAARDYSEGAVWSTALAAPYLYVAQADNGLNVFRFADPADTASLTWVRRYDKSWFGHRVNQVWVMGSLLVAAAVQDNYGVTLADISDPAVLVKRQRYDLTTVPKIRQTYSWTLAGTRLLAAERFKSGLNPSGLGVYDLDLATFRLTGPTAVSGGCGAGGYAALQDGMAHLGLSTCYQKIDIAARRLVGPTSPPWSIGITGADNDFATPFGNAVVIGNDHHVTPGSAILCHVASADKNPPTVTGRVPVNGATGVKITTGVGLSFSDGLKQWTVGPATLAIRVRGGSTAVPGYYSYQLGVVNFRPAAPLARNTTYEVAVGAGITDLAGNAAAPSTSTFTTVP